MARSPGADRQLPGRAGDVARPPLGHQHPHRHRTTGKLAAQLVCARAWFKHRGRLGLSDAILAFLTLNVLVSGVVDYVDKRDTPFPLRPLTGLPIQFIGWHGLSTVILCYLVVHILRRQTRLRRSQIR